MTELKNCPFCGGVASITSITEDERTAYREVVSISCGNCNAKLARAGDTSRGGYADNSKVFPEAIAAWNRRASTSASEAEPVADRGWSNAEIWMVAQAAGIEDNEAYSPETLCERIRALTTPLSTPASDDHVEAVREVAADLEWVHRQGGLGYRIHDKLEKCISVLAAMGSTKP